jgi:prefoldin subunit 5
MQSEMLREIKDGVSAREVYQRALDIVKKEKPELEKNFVKNAGFGVSDLLSNKCPPVSNSFRPEPSVSPRLRQAQLLQTQLSPHELVYQESFIREREAEIQEIESDIHELSEIFCDLGTLVDQQGGMIGM